MNGITVITQSAQLSEYCSDWRKAAYVTVDTEFMREHTYWPKLCLVQVGGPDESVVIDPLAEGIDLTPLYELLINPNVLKVFHAARQDVELFHHLTGQVPTPLFDTQLAAMVCGFGDSVGYEKLAARLAGVNIARAAGLPTVLAFAVGLIAWFAFRPLVTNLALLLLFAAVSLALYAVALYALDRHNLRHEARGVLRLRGRAPQSAPPS